MQVVRVTLEQYTTDLPMQEFVGNLRNTAKAVDYKRALPRHARMPRRWEAQKGGTRGREVLDRLIDKPAPSAAITGGRVSAIFFKEVSYLTLPYLYLKVGTGTWLGVRVRCLCVG